MAVVFWEAFNAQQDGWPISTEISRTYDLTLSRQPVPNDEASSCTLVDVRGGTVIEVYNSSEGNPDNGYTKITVTQNLAGPFIISSFQKDELGPGYTVDYNGKGTVDGRVSLIKITAG